MTSVRDLNTFIDMQTFGLKNNEHIFKAREYIKSDLIFLNIQFDDINSIFMYYSDDEETKNVVFLTKSSILIEFVVHLKPFSIFMNRITKTSLESIKIERNSCGKISNFNLDFKNNGGIVKVFETEVLMPKCFKEFFNVMFKIL